VRGVHAEASKRGAQYGDNEARLSRQNGGERRKQRAGRSGDLAAEFSF
jgi:hypothetical protein